MRSLLPSRRAAEHGCLCGCARSSWRPTSLAARPRVRPASPTGSSRPRARTPRQTGPSRCSRPPPPPGSPPPNRTRRARSSPRSSRRPAHVRPPTTPDSSGRCSGLRSPPATPTSPSASPMGSSPAIQLREHALCAARAQLAEHAGDHADAASPLRRSGRTLATVRERPRTRPRPARPGTLPASPSETRQPSNRSARRRAVQLDGLPPRPRRNERAPRANSRRCLVGQELHSVRNS